MGPATTRSVGGCLSVDSSPPNRTIAVHAAGGMSQVVVARPFAAFDLGDFAANGDHGVDETVQFTLTSSTPSWNAASWRTGSCACAAARVATTSCWPSAASGADSAPHAVPGACRRRRRTWWITSSAPVPVRQWVLSLPIPLRLASWPRSPNWSRLCCRWCSAWSRGTCWNTPGGRRS